MVKNKNTKHHISPIDISRLPVIKGVSKLKWENTCVDKSQSKQVLSASAKLDKDWEALGQYGFDVNNPVLKSRVYNAIKAMKHLIIKE